MQNNLISYLRNLRVNNWHFKLLALVLAALTFYVIRGVTGFEIPYSIPLEVQVEKGIAILDQPKTVEVTFRGSQGDLRGLDHRQIRAVVAPSNLGELGGSVSVSIGTKNVVGASGVRVTRVRPEVVVITFDREVEKVFRVIKPRTIGKPAAGKVEIDYAPQYVSISGPRKRLLDREVVETEPIDVNGCAQSFSKRVRVLSPSDVAVTRIEPPEITATVNIVTESVSKEWTNVLIRALLEAGSTNSPQFRPQTVNVTLHGRKEVLNLIADDSLRAFVDCIGLDPAQVYELPIAVHLPSGLEVTATLAPETVKVMFKSKRP